MRDVQCRQRDWFAIKTSQNKCNNDIFDIDLLSIHLNLYVLGP